MITQLLKTSGSPWGSIHAMREKAPGIISISTASHGGLWLSPERWEQFQAVLPFFAPYAGPQWLEEDCDYGLACLVWPEVFGAQQVRGAVRMIKGWWGKEEHPPLLTWLNSAGKPLVDLADRWEQENADKWEVGCEGTSGKGWFVSLHRVSDRAEQTRFFPEMSRQQFYTDAELALVSSVHQTKEVSVESFNLPSGKLAAATAQ